jgi:translation initiation factor 2B subunit (eIF-2B alpha/beta/delta family)
MQGRRNLETQWKTELDKMAADHHSPSSALASKAAELLSAVAEDDPEMLADVARGVVLSQPSMAALGNVANVALRAMQVLGLKSVTKALETLEQGVKADRVAAAEALVQEIDAPVRVVTTSASAAVVEGLQALRRADRLQDVVCAEARPILEGTALARWLREQGYSVTLTSDAGLCEFLRPGAIFVVGTDAILPHAIANKTGTRVYATWSRLMGVPSYVLASRDKFYLPELTGLFDNPQRPAEELLQKPPEGLRVDNRAFDLTARSVWRRILVGSKTVEEAESLGDHALAEALKPLI